MVSTNHLKARNISLGKLVNTFNNYKGSGVEKRLLVTYF